jgi:hypothetical protein
MKICNLHLVEKFVNLPFAFSNDDEISFLADQIADSKFHNVIHWVKREIAVHRDCDNYIKANVMASFLEKVQDKEKFIIALKKELES